LFFIPEVKTFFQNLILRQAGSAARVFMNLPPYSNKYMNQNNILSIARGVLSGVEPVRENIYRGELRIRDSEPAGIFFLDLSGNVTAEGFGEYQEKLLADEYYSQPGRLQWNYYLFLLQDVIDNAAKDKIEHDDKYARKFVVNEEGFEDFFKLEDSSTQLSGNIVIEWKKKLDEVGLQEVYSKVAFTTGVENYLKNTVPGIKPSLPADSSSGEQHLKCINRIILKDSYREYPKPERDFQFGKVNLFSGSNGVGKTSLFEAIELIACGMTFRNKDKNEPDKCIEAFINNNRREIEICTPSNNAKYRSRDLFWYRNDYGKSNYLANSFNRFNFFNM
jgi:DNA repair protein SbcC/Rad50